MASLDLGKNKDSFVSACFCHLCHIATSSASDAFSKICGIDIEDVCIDTFYWLQKYATWIGKLDKCFDFYNPGYQQVLNHLPVCSLSLEPCLNRILKKFPIWKVKLSE